jgi:hypothetical protein
MKLVHSALLIALFAFALVLGGCSSAGPSDPEGSDPTTKAAATTDEAPAQVPSRATEAENPAVVEARWYVLLHPKAPADSTFGGPTFRAQ